MEYVSFDKAFEYLLPNEGEYSNIPEDPGGPTNWGITQEDLKNYRGTDVSVDDVKNMSMDEAKDIYKLNYWGELGGLDVSQQAIATCLFDCGVLYGPVTAINYAKQILRGLGLFQDKDDLVMALNLVDPKEFIHSYRERIITRINWIIENNPTQEVFRQGWMNRANRLLTLI